MIRRNRSACLFAVLALSFSCAIASDADPHAAHRTAMQKTSYTTSIQNYVVPDVELIDQTGAPIALRSLLESGQSIALNFVFTTCTTICPVMTATFAQMQRELGSSASEIKMVSISIDPDYDRPDVLSAYAKQFQADDDWLFLTGDSNDIAAVLRSFDSFAGSKMNHQPSTFLRSSQSSSWVRIDGIAGGADLAQEVTARLLN
jgi:protein SCO1/2